MLEETKMVIDRLDKTKSREGYQFGELKLDTVTELECLGYRIFRTRFYAPYKETIQYEVFKPFYRFKATAKGTQKFG